MDQVVLNSSETFVEGVRLISRPLDSDMGVMSLTPFVVSVSAETSNYEELMLDLYSLNSKSIPYTSELNNNWSALKPQWRFLDSNGDIVEDQISIDFDTEIVDENGDVRGGVGSSTFYYVDDIPSDFGCPVMLQCTLNTLNYYDKDYDGSDSSMKSYYNSEMTTIIPFQVYSVKPGFIHFSQNGAIDIYSLQWVGNSIDGYVTINGVPRDKFIDYEKCAVDYPIIFNSPIYESISGSNVLDYTLYPLLSSEISGGSGDSSQFSPFEMSSGVATGGWAEFSITGLVESENAMLSGAVDVVYNNADYDYTATSEMWISNSNSNMIHKLETTYIDSNNTSLSAVYPIISDNINNNAYTTGFSVPFYDESYYNSVKNADILSNVNELSGYSGVYGMAIDGYDNVWNLDFELDRIYKRNSAGELQFTIDLQSLEKGVDIPEPYADSEYTWYGPSSISLDRTGNAYVTLYNSPSAMKITSTGDIDGYFMHPLASENPLPASANEGTYYRPVDVEVGVDGSFNILYSNDAVWSLINFDSDGLPGNSFDGNDESRPFDMAYNREDDSDVLYVTQRGADVGSPYRGVYRYDITGLTSTRLNLCIDPTYITIDIYENIWFAFDGNKIGFIPAGTVSNVGTSFDYFEIPDPDGIGSVVGGLACDSSGFLNIIQSYTNIVYRQNIQGFIDTGVSNLYGIKITPDENYIIINDNGVITKVYALSGEPVDSLQAYGDWTGVSWDSKFSSEFEASGTSTISLSGSSSIFELKSFKEEYDLRRHNESWDMKEQINSYVIPDFQKQFTDLWDDLIGNTVGDDSSGYQTFGRQFYEKISNFVANHSDLDFANIDQIYSMFECMDLGYNNYNFNYPADLKRWMNVLSISFNKLKGTQYQCNRNFMPSRYEDINECEVCGEIHASNMGEQIISPTMTVGEAVVIRDTFKSENAYDIFYPPLSGDFQQLSDYYGFRSPFDTNYEVFEYIPTVSTNTQSEGFIDWDSSYNDVAISGIDLDDWWGDGGYVEQIFTQSLYNGLNLAVEYYTEDQSEISFTPNIISDLTYDTTSIIESGMLSSSFLVPVKANTCSPVAGYAVPFYSTTDVLTGESISIGGTLNEIYNGYGVSNNYIELEIDDELYYAPTYTISETLLPVVGSGISFENGIVTVDTVLESNGCLVFENNSSKYLIPVYQAKSDV